MDNSSSTSSLQKEGRASHRSFCLPALQTSPITSNQTSLSASFSTMAFPSLSSTDTNTMSPPITPARKSGIQMSLPVMELPPTPRTSIDERPEISPTLSTSAPQTLAMTELTVYHSSYRLGRHLGSGAWSNVYLAEELSSNSSPPKPTRGLTPPPSPGISAVNRRPKFLAIKKAQHQRAKAVIAREARMLSFIFSDPASASFVIGFHGFDTDAQGIVLDFAPLTLKRYAEESLTLAKQNFSTSTMHDPVIGTATWKHFARTLISGLAWLHARGIAHGDVKTDNILLKQTSSARAEPTLIAGGGAAAYQPVLCDFSTAHMVNGDDSSRDDADDAITTTYASPELLASFRFTTNKLTTPVDWQKADVWSMGVCLVVAAVGVEPYAAQHSGMMKLHYAKLGDVLGSVRNDSGQATRIMKGSLAARTAALALARTAEARVSAAEWLKKLDF